MDETRSKVAYRGALIEIVKIKQKLRLREQVSYTDARHLNMIAFESIQYFEY